MMIFKKITVAVLSLCIIFSAMPIAVNAVENTETKYIALTFDDGPNTTTTSDILNILAEYDAKASFFLIGNNINDESAKSVKRAYDMGCEIDNHSKSHPNMGSMSAEEIQAEVSFVDEKVYEITGEYPKFFRPPFIDTSQTMYENIDVPFICGIDCQDYVENVTAQERADYILNGARDGVIVLLHDAAGNSQTVDALHIAIPKLIEQGYEFVTLTELFELQGEIPRKNMMYTYVSKYPCGGYFKYQNIFSGTAEGEPSWGGWSNTAILDRKLLESLGDSYAIEVEYSCEYEPVIALQKWSGTAIWQPVKPSYYNGDKACFMASDVLKVLNELGVSYSDLDRMTVTPYGGNMTVTNVDILVKNGVSETVKGDINADGKFNVADVVMLQKWLLAVPDTKLEDWQAGDLCMDNRIDVFDLCMMKRLLLSQEMQINPLVGLSYDEAVKKGYISKSEYNYQITGGLKSTIESKIGRPLDYSVDRFYLVNNEKIGLNSNTKYLYNAETKDIYAVTEETPMNCSTWYWKGTKAAEYGLDDDMEKQNEFLDAMEFYGINEIYYSIGANKLVTNRDVVARFVKNAYARDMRVYLVTGNKTWLYEDSYETAIYNIFDKVAEYNGLVDFDARIAGISYDAEVWTNSEYNWKNNAETRKQQVKFIETAQAYANSKNLSVSHCLPFWIVRYDYTDDEGVMQNVYDSITQTANETILMIYRDTPEAIEKLAVQVQTNAENSILYYNEKNDCNLEIGVQADENSEGDYVTFYEEEKENPGYILGAISTIKDDLSAYENRITFAIHQAIALYEYYLTK